MTNTEHIHVEGTPMNIFTEYAQSRESRIHFVGWHSKREWSHSMILA